MENTIYIGRSVQGVMKNQLFTTRPDSLIAELSKTYRHIGALFVNVEDFASALQELNTPGSAIWQAAQEVK